MSNTVHAEIMYQRQDGTNESVHSDICPHECDSDNMMDGAYRCYLHKCLDEWLDKSGGTGMFYIKNNSFNPFED